MVRRGGPWEHSGIAPGGMLIFEAIRQAGLDPQQVTGFAFGVGLERLAMLKYDNADIRDLWRLVRPWPHWQASCQWHPIH